MWRHTSLQRWKLYNGKAIVQVWSCKIQLKRNYKRNINLFISKTLKMFILAFSEPVSEYL